MSSIAHRQDFTERLACFLLLSYLLILVSASANASGIDDFAARLLCEADPDCELPQTESDNTLARIVILGIVLPDDAARDRDDEQEALVTQGSYLSVDGEVMSLSSTTGQVILPERGALSTHDFGSARIPSTTPIIITLPGKGREKDPN